MRAYVSTCAALAVLAGTLGACGKKDAATETAPAAQAEVVRQETPAPAAPAPAPAPAAIQTQPGPAGSSVALTRAAVTGDVLTLQFAVTMPPGGKQAYVQLPVDQVSVIDDVSAKKLGVLKDAEGRWMASPMSTATSDTLRFYAEEAATVVWFKLPAPPIGSPTVSINLPGVGPFDGVSVTR